MKIFFMTIFKVLAMEDNHNVEETLKKETVSAKTEE